MTAETLKPFITPTSAVNAFPAKQSSVTHSTRKTMPIALSIVTLVLVALIFTYTIWQTTRVNNDLHALRHEVEKLKQRLNINYLEDLAEFEKELSNFDGHDADEYNNDEDDDDDDDVGQEDDEDDDDEDSGNIRTDYDEYMDLVNQEKGVTQALNQDNSSDKSESAQSTSASSSSASNNDNVFDDFTSYNDSKKKRERKTRSIADLRNELPSNELAQNPKNQSRSDEQINDSIVTPNNNTKQHSPKHRPRTRQSRQRLLVRKGESPVSAKSADFPAASRAAAHFHLNRKVPHHESPIQLQSYQGDMYMGHATATSDNQWQQHFSVHNGVLTVHQAGLYYVYAQLCYNNTHDQNGFIIFHNSNAFLQCLNTVPTNMPKVHTCHTGGLIHLEQHESIHLRDIHRDRNVMLRDGNNRSFFGIIKL